MAGCAVLFTPYARDILRENGILEQDEALIAAKLAEHPDCGTLYFTRSKNLRLIKYRCLKGSNEVDLLYLYFKEEDVKLGENNIVIVIGIDEPNSPSGTWLEPEGLLQIIELIAGLARHVLN